jgi:hypothetical protein
MNRLFRHSQPTTPSSQGRDRRQRRPRPVMRLFILCGALVLILGMSATLVVAQSDRGLKQQEDQLIRQIVPLPNAPTKAPVYKPIPAPAPFGIQSLSCCGQSLPLRASIPKRDLPLHVPVAGRCNPPKP